MSNSHLSASGMKGLLPMLQLVSFKGTTSLTQNKLSICGKAGSRPEAEHLKKVTFHR